MQTSSISPAIDSRLSSTKGNQPGVLFLCETELTIPYMTYKIQDNRTHLMMRCDTPNPHIETISYNEYKNRSLHNINPNGMKKCQIHSTEDSVGYCQQHNKRLCIQCKQSHVNDHPKDLIILDNPFNLNMNYHCKDHPSNPPIFYCQQCKLSICKECAKNKHKNHPIINIKQQITSLQSDKLKEDFITYEENYFTDIASAYTQAQQELKKDYENHINVNKELFDIVRNILYTGETFEKSFNGNMFLNVRNIVHNLNILNFSKYQPGDINKFQNYLKSNLVINIHNIKDLNSTIITDLTRLTTDNTNTNNTEIKIDEDFTFPAHLQVGQQEKKQIGNDKEFEGITKIIYEEVVWSLCKLNDNLYAVGVESWNSTGKIHIVDYSNSTIIRSLTANSRCIWKGYGHKRNDYLLSFCCDSDIFIWNYFNGNCVAVLKGHCDAVRDIVELKAGHIISVSDDKSIKYWNMMTFKCYKTINDAHTTFITCIQTLQDKDGITGGGDGVGKIWKDDATTKEDVINSIEIESSIWSGLELRNSRLLVGLLSGDIGIYNINGFTQLNKFQQHTRCVTIMVLLSDGYLISGSDDSHFIIWDINTLSCIQKLEENKDCIFTDGIEMKGNEIISGSDDKTVKTWKRK